jgi:hypothetical protein
MRDDLGEIPLHRRIAWVSSVRQRTRLVYPRFFLLPVTPTLVIKQIPQVKMRLPEPDVNGRCDRRDDFRFRKGHPESAEQRSDYSAVTRWLHSVRQ